MYASTWNGRVSRCCQNELGLFLPPLVFGGHIEKRPNSFKTVIEVKEQYFQMES